MYSRGDGALDYSQLHYEEFYAKESHIPNNLLPLKALLSTNFFIYIVRIDLFFLVSVLNLKIPEGLIKTAPTWIPGSQRPALTLNSNF